jgi:hypothetical protein
MRRMLVAVAVVIGSALAMSVGAGASAPDVARIAGTRVSRHHVDVGSAIRLGAAAVDRGSNDYEVDFRFPDAAVDLVAQRCIGAAGRGPSPDTPFCEYDDYTTTTRTVTHTIGVFVVKPGAPRVFRIEVCAASFTSPPAVPDCRVHRFRVG